MRRSQAGFEYVTDVSAPARRPLVDAENRELAVATWRPPPSANCRKTAAIGREDLQQLGVGPEHRRYGSFYSRGSRQRPEYGTGSGLAVPPLTADNPGTIKR
jgi:hypothetical protein